MLELVLFSTGNVAITVDGAVVGLGATVDVGVAVGGEMTGTVCPPRGRSTD